ncbi:MAG: hypothetical protein ACKOPG_12275 [Novosphingobium sp.]
MILSIILVVVSSALIAIGVKSLFPKRRAWLPVLVSAILPPLIIFPVGFYYVLVDIGLKAEQGAAQSDMIDRHAPLVGRLMEVAGIWPFVAIATAFAALHFFARYKSNP